METGLHELLVERVVAGGYGLARTPQGTALVRGGLPGERVLAYLARRKGTLQGTVDAVVQPHPQRDDRLLPPGADLPMAYDAQLPVKEGIVRESLERVAKMDAATLQPICPSPSALGYRTAAQYAVARDGRLAARAAGGATLVPLDEDALVAPPLAAAFALLSDSDLPGVRDVLLRGSLHEGRVLVGLVGERGGPFSRIARSLPPALVAGVEWIEHRSGRRFHGAHRRLAGETTLLEDFGGVRASVTVRSFAQINPPAAGLLYREAAELAGTGRRAVDLYAGSGVLALHIAAGFERVVAIEIATESVRRGEADVARAGVEGVRFHRGDAREVRRFLPADVVAVNPPRAGIGPEVMRAILRAQPPRVLYVSCDPATWARDVGRLTGDGYRLEFARPYDFYPYTHHVEVLSLLTR